MLTASDARLTPVCAYLTLPVTVPSVPRTRNFRTYHQAKRRTSDITCASRRACLDDPCRAGRSLRTTYSQHRVSAAVAEQNTATQDTEAEDSNQVQAFLQWLAVQGVDDLKEQNCKLGVYNAEKGERGILSLQDIQAGSVVLRLPLRLAITDHTEDKDSNNLIYEDAPWSIRLACKLLREKAKGSSSPWHPYLQVLPQHVPSPLQLFAWEDMQDIEVPDTVQQLHSASWLLSDAYPRLSPKATGNASREDFEWAVSVVHSRTFGTAAQEGGTAVHMLLPLVDFLNHSGDETECFPGDRAVPSANVRWHLVAPPTEDPSQGFKMHLVAREDIPQGQELLLSYGDRNNDDFFLHYGFVPLRNPHDDTVLFQDLPEALDWHYDQFMPQSMSKDEAKELYIAAAEAGQAQEQPPAPEDRLTAAMQEQEQKLRVYPGALVDGRLIAAYQHLAKATAADPQSAVAAVATRSQQLLAAMTPLPDDLKALAADPWTEQDDRWYYVALAQHYGLAIQKHTEAQGALLSNSLNVPETSTPTNTDTQQAEQTSSEQSELSGVSSVKESQAGMLSPAKRLALTYRSQKKMLLWDVVLSSQN